MKRKILACLLSGLGMLPMAAQAQNMTVSSQYKVSIYGLTIGQSNFKTTIRGNKLNLNGTLSSAGIAKIFDKTTGNAAVNGTLATRHVVPSNYRVNYRHGGRNKSTQLTYRGGNVAKVANNPAIRKKQPWAPVSQAHLKAVSDPLTATIVRAKSKRDVCKRTLRVFDGQTRADLRLSYLGEQTFRTRGFSGKIVRCRAKFVPISGYQKSKRQIAYLRDKSRIEIGFARLGNSDVYVPVKANIGTQIGTVSVRATKLQTTGS